MQEQNFKKHVQLVPGFHVLTFAVILAAFLIAVILLIHRGFSHETVFYFLITIALGLLFYYTRQFGTGNQDRIIRAEENFRCFRLTGKPLDTRLTRSQIIGLRFAPDEEFSELAQRAVTENLTQKDIKAAVSKWRADHHRI